MDILNNLREKPDVGTLLLVSVILLLVPRFKYFPPATVEVVVSIISRF